MKRLFYGFILVLSLVLAACAGNASPTPFEPIDNFRDFSVGYTLLRPGIIVMEAADSVLWAREFGTTSLHKSYDQGDSWVFAYSFNHNIQAIYADGFGNIFVSTSEDRWAEIGTGQLFKSDDGGQNFRHVLNLQSGAAVWWSIASQNGYMLVSEYGFKQLGNNARRIYRSHDFGENWELIYEPPPIYNYHKHKTLITDDGIVYQSVGDGANARIMRSADMGGSWETVVYGFQPTAAIAFENHILWGLDGGPWMGIARYNRQSTQMEAALVLPYPFYGPSYDMVMVDNVVYAAFLSYAGYEVPAAIFYSKDEGQSWHILGHIEKPSLYWGIGFYAMAADEDFIYIDFGSPIYQGGDWEFFRGTLRLELLNLGN
ncbi:MAG: glycoside hydrolase [Clostridiales bacterium]|jgi:photosystem II stability/assembly factor-like uncharacterized protein|nr:glycoside hydrolase [Clostridiales bacterium]